MRTPSATCWRLDALPKEMDYSLLLPPDNSSSGFDNIADLLFVSPTTMERYLDAARKISRLAVGDPTMPVMVNSYRLSPEQTAGHARGCAAVRHARRAGRSHAIFRWMAITSSRSNWPAPAREPQQIEISVDGERMQLVTVGDNGGGGRGRGGRGGRGGGGGDKPLEVRIPVKAGPRLIGVAFVERTEARDEAHGASPHARPRFAARAARRDHQRSLRCQRPGRHAQPSPDLCVPSDEAAADEIALRRNDSFDAARRAYRRPVTDADLDGSDAVLHAGRAEAAVSTWAFRRRWNVCW